MLWCAVMCLFADVSNECSANLFKVQVVFLDTAMFEDGGATVLRNVEKQQTVQCNISEDPSPQQHLCEHIESRKLATS
jgi:hypothetical protein